MRVLHLIDHLGPGGAQTSLIDLVEARAAQVDPMVWSLTSRVLAESRERLAKAGVSHEAFGVGPANPAGFARLRRIAPRPPH